VWGGVRAVDWADAKADCLSVLQELGVAVDKLTTKAHTLSWYHPGRSGAFALGNKVLGYFGELHPQLLARLDIDFPVVGFEVHCDAVPTAKSKQGRKGAVPLSDYQAVTRDFAFLVDSTVATEQVVRAAKMADKQELIKDAHLFDVYQGKGVPEGKKSVALSVTLQAKDHTLNDEELEITSGKVVVAVNKAVDGVLRE
jgi:phenylalanyl-tRNA synthetase beta chain